MGDPVGDTGAWTVTNIVDGDAIDVRTADGTEERIRVVAIDTPERGECGFNRASRVLADLSLGEEVTLTTTAGGDDRTATTRCCAMSTTATPMPGWC